MNSSPPLLRTLAAAAALFTAACPSAPEADVFDAGPLLEPADAGIPERPEEQPDAGIRVCFDVPPMAEADLPRCDAATQDCILACAPDADGCSDACLAADTFPPTLDNTKCSDCSFRQIFSCLDDNGCEAETAAAMCCIFETCAGQGDACINTECQDDFIGLFTCGQARAPSCFDYAAGAPSTCFAPP